MRAINCGMASTKAKSAAIPPRLATDRWFRSCARKLLVELPNEAPGLALKVSGPDSVVMVFPRFGRRIENRDDLAALRWYSVHVDGEGVEPRFDRMKREEVDRFLEDLAEVS